MLDINLEADSISAGKYNDFLNPIDDSSTKKSKSASKNF